MLRLTYQSVTHRHQVVRMGEERRRLRPRRRGRSHAHTQARVLPHVNSIATEGMSADSSSLGCSPRKEDGHIDGGIPGNRGYGQAPHDGSARMTHERMRGYACRVGEHAIEVALIDAVDDGPHTVKWASESARAKMARGDAQLSRATHAEARPELGRERVDIHPPSVPCPPGRTRD